MERYKTVVATDSILELDFNKELFHPLTTPGLLAIKTTNW